MAVDSFEWWRGFAVGSFEGWRGNLRVFAMDFSCVFSFVKATFSHACSPQIHANCHASFHAAVHSMLAALFHDTIPSFVHELGDYGVVDSAREQEPWNSAPNSFTFRLLSDITFGAAQPIFSVHRTHSPPRRMCGWYSLCTPADPRSGAQPPADARARFSSY